MVITLKLHLAVSLGAQLLYSPMVTTLGPPFGPALPSWQSLELALSLTATYPAEARSYVITTGRTS